LRIDRLLQQALCLHDVRDVRLVVEVFLASRGRLADLALVVGRERLLSVLDLRQQPRLWVVDEDIEVIDLLLQGRDGLDVRLQCLVVLLALGVAPFQILLVVLALLRDKREDLLDFFKHHREGVASLEENGDLSQAQRLPLPRGGTQQCLHFRPHVEICAVQAADLS